jgi:hypothetical protein
MDTSVTAEPIWRQILNWGCVLYFLGLPAVALSGALFHFSFDPQVTPGASKFLTEFHFAVTALVATMAGLNTFDRYKGVSSGNGPKAKTEKST